MRPSIEQQVRDFVGAERKRIEPPALMSHRILHALEQEAPRPPRRASTVVPAVAAMAAMVVIAIGVVWLRAAPHPSAAMAQGSWSKAPSMLEGRGAQTATLLPNGNVLVVGGSQIWRAVASAALFVPSTNSWRPAGSMSTPRMGQTATLLNNGDVLVAGGSDADLATIDAVSSSELYDPKTNSWSPAASMHVARAFHTATLLPDGRVAIIGGVEQINQRYVALADVELYDPTRNTWSIAAPEPRPRGMHAAVLLNDGRILILGGSGSRPVAARPGALATQNSVDLYDPSTNSWSLLPSMHYARALPTGMLLPDGRVLVIGDDGPNEGTAELFNPRSERWSDAPTPGLRAESVAVRLRSGEILVAGGVGESSATLFDWRRNAWHDAGHMQNVRASASGTLLANGDVLVAGGFGHLIAPFATAEIYDSRGRSSLATARTPVPPSRLIEVTPVAGGVALLLVLLSRLLRERPWRRHPDQWITFPASRTDRMDD